MMKISKLFMTLPEAYACTPDGMEIDRYGNLILSCPNYADEHLSLIHISEPTRRS